MDEQQLNEYRQPWESDEHWTLRKEFIERFWDDFPEDRLLCLAQVYSNVELLGCSYPAPVMRQIRELSKSLNECKELREKRKERAAVQFVKAKQKAPPPPRNSWNNSGSVPRKRPDSENNSQADCDTPSGTLSKKLKTSDSKLSSDSSASVCSSGNRDLGTTKQSSPSKNSQQESTTVCINAEKSSSISSRQESDLSPSAPSTSQASSQKDIWPKCVKDNMTSIIQFIRKYLAIQNTPVEILNNMSTKFALKVDYNLKYFPESAGLGHECSIEIDNVFIVKTKELTKKKARSEAAKLAIDMLMSPSAGVEKSSSSTSSESNLINSTNMQDKQKFVEKTSSSSDDVVKSSSNTSAKTLSRGSIPGKTSSIGGTSANTHNNNNRNSILFVNQNRNSGIRENTGQKNSLLSDPRVHYDSQRVPSNVYQNSNYIPRPWTKNSSVELDPWVNTAVTVPDPWIHNTVPGPNSWTNNNTLPGRNPWTNNNTVPGLNPWANNNTKLSGPLRPQSNQHLDRKNPCPEFLVILDNTDIIKSYAPASIFTQSANFNHVPFEFSYETVGQDAKILTRAEISLKGQKFCSAEAENKPAAKEAVSKLALDILRKTAYTIKVNDEHEDGFTVTRNQVFNTAESNNSLTESNIGCKMLKMMGWSGGGIGKVGKQGIEEPVKAVEKHKFGQGLGYTKKGNEEVSFTARAEQIIQDYAKSKSTSDLIFSTEFSKEERREIHRIASKYNLKNNSKGGKGDGRHIIISRRYTAQQLVNCLIQAGGRTHKYELMPPTG